MSLFTLANQVSVQSSGRPHGLARLYFFRAGTLTHQAVYTTAALSVAHDQPVEADADGQFPPIFLNTAASFDYRYQLKDSADALIEDIDNYPKNGFASSISSEIVVYARTDAEIAASVTPADYSYQPGHFYRYGGSPDAVASVNNDALADMLAVSATHDGYVPAGIYQVSDGQTIPDFATVRFARDCNWYFDDGGSGEYLFTNHTLNARSGGISLDNLSIVLRTGTAKGVSLGNNVKSVLRTFYCEGFIPADWQSSSTAIKA
jgi:hypothetical protein